MTRRAIPYPDLETEIQARMQPEAVKPRGWGNAGSMGLADVPYGIGDGSRDSVRSGFHFAGGGCFQEGEEVSKVPSGWKAYYPEDSESADDACEIEIYDFQARVRDAEHAAELACEYDYGERDGWERTMGSEFIIIVISPNGEHTAFTAWNEVSVDHRVSRVDK